MLALNRPRIWEIANNEIVIIRATGLTGKPIVLEPKLGVCFPRIFWNVGRRSVPWWESGVEDVPTEGLRARQAGARALVLAAVVASTTSRVVATSGSFSRVVVGASAGVDGATRVAVVTEAFIHRDNSALPAAWWCLVD